MKTETNGIFTKDEIDQFTGVKDIFDRLLKQAQSLAEAIQKAHDHHETIEKDIEQANKSLDQAYELKAQGIAGDGLDAAKQHLEGLRRQITDTKEGIDALTRSRERVEKDLKSAKAAIEPVKIQIFRSALQRESNKLREAAGKQVELVLALAALSGISTTLENRLYRVFYPDGFNVVEHNENTRSISEILE